MTIETTFKTFPFQSLYMTLAIDKVNGHNLSNTASAS